eukprot:SAG22_NODE_3586_length_1630_cov_1.564337_2_plen_359_part_01
MIEWCAAQPWSTGKVASHGGSYPGQNQWMTAVHRPPSLVCMKPNVAATSIYHNWAYHGGCFRLAFNFGWGAVRMPHRTTKVQLWHDHKDAPAELSYDKVLKHLPLPTMDVRAAGSPVLHYREWVAHPEYDEYWQHVSVEEKFDQVAVPAFTEGGWFDIFLGGTINGYVGTKHLGSRMLIGPWGHGASRSFGDLDFGPTAFRDRAECDRVWFNHQLLGTPLGLPADKPVELFYMGANVWQFETDWPLPATAYTDYHLQPGHGLDPTPVSAAEDRGGGEGDGDGGESFDYDPDDPCPTLGGNNCCGAPTIAGPKDQRPLYARCVRPRFFLSRTREASYLPCLPSDCCLSRFCVLDQPLVHS